jgi:Rrf2 family iron-sulfur cluster assembly transcriptional regulator
MHLYGKTTQTAIAAMSRLAQVYDPEGQVRLSSSDIAQSRNLPQPVVAKVLTILSQAGLIVGSPGPGGGYALARSPESITLYEVASLFERMGDQVYCPFGPEWCGKKSPCPLHEQLVVLLAENEAFLRRNTFGQFVQSKKEASRPASAGGASPRCDDSTR